MHRLFDGNLGYLKILVDIFDYCKSKKEAIDYRYHKTGRLLGEKLYYQKFPSYSSEIKNRF